MDLVPHWILCLYRTIQITFELINPFDYSLHVPASRFDWTVVGSAHGCAHLKDLNTVLWLFQGIYFLHHHRELQNFSWVILVLTFPPSCCY